jgi:hypothetical protein
MKYLFALTIVFCSQKIHAQDTLTAALLQPNAYIFTVEKGQIHGPGASVIQHIIDTSHYVLLGEKHQSARLGELSAALLPKLAKAGFHNFAIEVGPNAAERLEQLATPPSATLEQLQAFTKQYANKTFFKMPINFFHGYEDALFLQKASEMGFDLWGLDQELYYSVEFLLNDLLKLAKGQTNFKRFKKLHRRAMKRYKWLNVKDDLKKRFPRNCILLSDEKVNAFLDAFAKDHSEAQRIIEALRNSWQIYCDNEKGNYDKANQARAAYMKENFRRQYQAAKSRKEQPKVFAKMGDMHLSSGTSRLGVDDIGSYIFELAAEEGLKATNIRHIRRFYQSKKQVIDYETSGIEWVKQWRPFVELGKREEWVLIDLRPFRASLAEGKLVTHRSAAHDIKYYDFILISPEDARVKALWK